MLPHRNSFLPTNGEIRSILDLYANPTISSNNIRRVKSPNIWYIILLLVIMSTIMMAIVPTMASADVSSYSSPTEPSTNHDTITTIPSSPTAASSIHSGDTTRVHSLDTISSINDDRSLLIFTTLDGAIVALDATTGMIRWQLDTGGPLINVGSSRMSSRARSSNDDSNTHDNDTTDDDAVSVFPGVYGELFTHVQGKGLHRLAYNAWQLVDRSPLPLGDSILFFGNKTSTHFGLDPWTGAVHQSPAHESGETSNDTLPPSSSSSRSFHLALVRTNFGIRAKRVDVADGNNGWDLCISRTQLYLHTGSRKNTRGNPSTNNDDNTSNNNGRVYDSVPLIRVSSNGSISAHDGHGRFLWHYKLPSQPVSLHGLVRHDDIPSFAELPLSFDMPAELLHNAQTDTETGMQYLLQFNALSPGSEHWYGTVLALANHDHNDDSSSSTAVTRSHRASSSAGSSSNVLLRPPHHMHMKSMSNDRTASNSGTGSGWLHDDALIGHDTATNKLLMGPNAGASLLPLQRAAIDHHVARSSSGALVTTSSNDDNDCVSTSSTFPACLGGIYNNHGDHTMMDTTTRSTTTSATASATPLAASPLLLTATTDATDDATRPALVITAPLPDISVTPITRARHGYSTRVAEPDDADIADHPASHAHVTAPPTQVERPIPNVVNLPAATISAVPSARPVPPPTLVSGPIPYSSGSSSPAWYQDQHNHQYVLHLPDWLAQYLIIGVLVLVFLFGFVTYKMFQARQRLRESVANTPKVSPQLHSSSNMFPSDLSLPSAAMFPHPDRTPVLTSAAAQPVPSPMMNGMMAGTAPSPLPSPYLTSHQTASLPHVPSPLLIPSSSPPTTSANNGSPTLPPLPPSQLSHQSSQPGSSSSSSILQSPYRGALSGQNTHFNTNGLTGFTLSGDSSNYSNGGVDPLLGTLLPAPLTLQASPPLSVFTPLPSPPSLLRVHTSPNLAKYSQSAHPITSSNRFGRAPRVDRAPSHDIAAGQWMNHQQQNHSGNGSSQNSSGSGSGSDGHHNNNGNRRQQHRPRSGTVDSYEGRSPRSSSPLDDDSLTPRNGHSNGNNNNNGAIDELSPINGSNGSSSNNSSAMPSPRPLNGPASPAMLTRARSRPISATTRGSGHHATMPHSVLQRALSDSPPSSWMSSDSPIPSSSSNSSRNGHVTSSIGSGAGTSSDSPMATMSDTQQQSPPSWFQGTLPSSTSSTSTTTASSSSSSSNTITTNTTSTPAPGLLSRALQLRTTSSGDHSNNVSPIPSPPPSMSSSFTATSTTASTIGVPRASPAHKKHASMGGAMTGFGVAKSRFRDIPLPRHESKLTTTGHNQLPTPSGSAILGTSPLDQFSRMISKDRFAKDFETTGDRPVIGQGGFGTVLRARNRLDDREYAIKKIKLWQHQTEVNAVVLREVKSLAKLDHPNIVRYFQSWMEEIEDGDDDDESDGEGDEDEGSINSSFNSSIASPLPSTSATGPVSPFPPQPNAYYNAQAAKRKQSLVAAAAAADILRAKEAVAAKEEEERKAKAAAALATKSGSVTKVATNGKAVASTTMTPKNGKTSAAVAVAAKAMPKSSAATPSKKPSSAVATNGHSKKAARHDDTDTDEDDAAYEDTDQSDADDIRSPTASSSSKAAAAKKSAAPAKAAAKTAPKPIPAPASAAAAKKPSIPAKKAAAAVKSDDDEEDEEEEDDDEEEEDDDDDNVSVKGKGKKATSVNTSIDDDDDDNASVSSKTSTISPRAGSVADSDDDSRPTSPVAITRTLSDGFAAKHTNGAAATRPRATSAAVPSTKPLDTKGRVSNAALNAALHHHRRSDSLDSLSSLSSTEVPSPSGMTGTAGGLMSPISSAVHGTSNVGLSSLFFPMMPLMNPPSPSPSPSARVPINKKPTATSRGKAFRLYIQMQLCPHGTLEDWLNRVDRVVDPLMNMFLFHQIVSGLEHVHQQSLIHRDLKPSNIFMGSRNEIRIGDFGLSKDSVLQLAAEGGAAAACVNGVMTVAPVSPCVSEPARAEAPLIPRRRRGAKGPHTRGVGSPLYCSPEQLKGKSYNDKTDIFSLGIIFVEMHCTFSTQMERLTLLGNARRGELPPDKFNPAARDFVRMLLDEDATNRPSAQDVLAHPFVQLSRDHMPSHITPSHAAGAAAAVAAATASAPVNQLGPQHPFQTGAQDWF